MLSYLKYPVVVFHVDGRNHSTQVKELKILAGELSRLILIYVL